MKLQFRFSFLVAVFLLSSTFVLTHEGHFASAQQIEPQQNYSQTQQPQLQTNEISNQDPFQAGVDNDITVVRDSETILLKGQTIPAHDFIHLYDASPYKIINGHLATKIPCNTSFQPKVNILVGQAPKVQVIQLHLLEEMSVAGKMCIYHADLEPTSRVAHTGPEVTIGTITDIAIQNPTNKTIKFPPTSTMVIGVNEIEPGAGEIEH
jgi:hypothetical protein